MTCKSLRNTSEFTYYTYVINTYTSLWEKFQDWLYNMFTEILKNNFNKNSLKGI